MKTAYPLAALQTLRAEDVAEAKAALATAAAGLRSAEEAVQRASTALQLHREVTAKFDAERVAASRAADLQRRQAYRQRRRDEEAALGAALNKTNEALRKAQAEYEEAQQKLAHAQAEAKAVARHQERWAKGERAAAARRTDDEHDEHAQR